MFSLRFFLFILSACLVVCSLSVSAGFSCLCGCCNTDLQKGLCIGSSNWDGWAAENTAQCTGNAPNDITFCDAQCNNFYPNQCEAANVVSTCQNSDPNEQQQENIATQSKHTSSAADKLIKNATVLEYKQLQASLEKAAALAIKFLSAEQIKQLYAASNITSSTTTSLTAVNSVDSSVSISATSTTSVSVNDDSNDIPFLDNMACVCSCCESSEGFGYGQW